MQSFRLNVGDPGESRVYYCAHFIAAESGYFAERGLDVTFTRTQSGGHTAMGGQIGPVVAGECDACVGGPMVTMKLQEDGTGDVASFCGLVRGNPWVIAGRAGAAASVDDLSGALIIDSGNVTTATLCLKDALARAGLAGRVTLEPGSGDLAAEVARARADDRVLIHHSLHALGPLVASGSLAVVLPMAAVTPPVPWSAYIARRDRIAAHPAMFARFRDAIAAALQDLASRPDDELAARVARHYPDYGQDALAAVIGGYRRAGAFSRTPAIPVADMQAFAAIMIRAGWLSKAPDVDRLLDPEIAA